MLEGKQVSAMLTRSWKKSFKNCVNIPVNMKRCNECKDGILCTSCNEITKMKNSKLI